MVVFAPMPLYITTLRPPWYCKRYLCDYGQGLGIPRTSKQDHERPPTTLGAFCREILKILLDHIKGSDWKIHHHKVSIFFSDAFRSNILTKGCGRIKLILNMIPHSVSSLVGWLVSLLVAWLVMHNLVSIELFDSLSSFCVTAPAHFSILFLLTINRQSIKNMCLTKKLWLNTALTISG